MSDDSRRSHRFAKSWSPVFATDQTIEDDTPWIESRPRLAINEEDDELGFLLQDSQESGPSSHVEQVKRFCQREWLNNFESEAEARGQRQAAWLDFRTSFPGSSGGVRRYQNPSSPGTLHRHLKAPVCCIEEAQSWSYVLTLCLAIPQGQPRPE